jgi:hypothetical protein
MSHSLWSWNQIGTFLISALPADSEMSAMLHTVDSSVGVEDFRAVSKRRGGKASLFSEVRGSDGRRLRDGMGWDVALHYGDADRDCKTNLAGTSRSNEYSSDFSLGAQIGRGV